MAQDYQFKKGARGFGDAPTNRRPRFDDAFALLPTPDLKHHIDLRPVGGVVVVKVHFVPFIGRDGKESGFYTLCANWSLSEQDSKRDGECCACRDFGYGSGAPEKLRMKVSTRYYFHAFNVTALKSGQTKDSFGLVLANGKNWDDILGAISLNEGVSVADPKQGCILHWQAKNSAFKAGSLEFNFSKDVRHPVKFDTDAGVWKIKVGGEVYTGEEQDVLAVIQEPDAREMAEDFERLGLYARLAEAGVPSRRGGTAVAKPTGKPAKPADEDDDFDDLTDEDEAPKGKGKKPAKPADDDLDDLDEADEPEDEDEAPKPKGKAKKPAKPADDDFDEDDDVEDEVPKGKAKKPAKPAEDDDDFDALDDEDDEPAPKSKAKKPVDDDLDELDDEDDEPAPKPKGKAKKPAKPVEDEDDDFDDEDEDEAPAPKGKAKKPVEDEDDDFDLEDEDEEPAPKGKAKKPAKPVEDEDDDFDALDDEDDEPAPKAKRR